MINKLKIFFWFILCAAFCGSLQITAQTVGEETIAVNNSKLAGINLPTGARRIKEESVPEEFKNTLAKLVAAGGERVRQGDSEVVVWGENYQKAKSAPMIKNLEAALKKSGWEYEIGERTDEFVLFSLLRSAPQRRALVGFFVPSEDAFIFALTEMIRADASVSEKSDEIVEVLPSEEDLKEQPKPSNNSDGANSSKIVGAWFRSDGTGGARDPGGKTRYNSGTDTTFEFFADGKMRITIKKETLNITQCQINETTNLPGTYSISGNQLTMNLGTGSVVGTNSCQSSGNFKKSLIPSTLEKTFVVKNLESVFRPDAPLILCLDNSSDDKCFERLIK